MNIQEKYIELAKSEMSKELNRKVFDKDIYTLLNIPNPTFSHYKKGTRQLPNEIAFEIALLANVDPMEVIAAINEENAKSAKVKNWWSEQKRKAAGVAAVGVLTLSTTLPAGINSSFNNGNLYTLYED